jgi:cyclase
MSDDRPFLDRRRFLLTSLGGLAAAALPRPLAGSARSRAGALPLQPHRAELIELRRGVGIFVARGGTIGWLANADGALVVDSQYPDTAETCRALLADRGALPLDALLNTHHHGDHTAGNGVFRESARRIVAHARVPELQARATDPGVAADTTFEREWSLEVGDEVVRARHYGPAHTGGDCTVSFERAEVVHMGDLVFNRAYPFIDRDGGASVRGWIELLEAVAAEHGGDTVFVFGHARPGFEPTGDRADVLLQRDFLAAVLESAERSAAAGASREEAIAAELPGFPDHAPIVERMSLGASIGAAYDEVTGGR